MTIPANEFLAKSCPVCRLDILQRIDSKTTQVERLEVLQAALDAKETI